MGLLKSLFGGDSQQSGSGPPAAQMPFLTNMWNSAQNMAGQLNQYNQTGSFAPQGPGGTMGAGGYIPPRPVPSPGHTGTKVIAEWDRLYGGMNPAGSAGSAGPVSGAPGQPGQPGVAGAPGTVPVPFGMASNLFNQGQTLLGNAAGAMQPFSQQSYAPQQLAGLQSLIQQNLGQSFGQIRDASQMAGGFGGSGMGIQQNQAIQDANRTLMQGAGDIYAQDLARQQQAAQAGGALNLGAQNQLAGQYNLGVNAPMQSLFMPLVTQGGINQGYQTSSSSGSSSPGWLGGVGNFFGNFTGGG